MTIAILIIGSGAREHAIAKALQRSPQQPQIFCYASANNPGIGNIVKEQIISALLDLDSICTAALNWKIDLAIIGPEAPLESGLADRLWEQGIPVVGPTKILAQLETSKVFARDLLKKHNIAGSPDYKYFSNLDGVENYLQQLGENQYVIKADGLMGGKGVKVAGEHLHSFSEGLEFCQQLVDAQQSFVIEEKCIGQEFSLMSFCDGETLVPMPIVQDHKRAFINDEGPNTGGMGSYSESTHSLSFLTSNDVEDAKRINQQVLSALKQDYQQPYMGILYGSFMATKNGIRLIEYNVRFGDPESLNVLSILETDFLSICQSIVSGKLLGLDVKFSALSTVCKYVVPEGYPDHPLKNELIEIGEVSSTSQLYLGGIHAHQNKLYATGSRIAAIVGIAQSLESAEKIAEENVKAIKGKVFHRPDIGTTDALNRRIQHMQNLRGALCS